MGTFREDFEEVIKNLPSLKNPKDFLDFVETFDRRKDLFNLLKNDSANAKNELMADPGNQYLKRTMVRTTFAMIEGLLNIINQELIDISKNGFLELSSEELENLTEEIQTKKGERRPKFMSLNKKVPFSFGLFARKVGNIEYTIDIRSDGWRTFESAILIRNKLMHPRAVEDMILNQEHMGIILDANLWFLNIYSDVESKTTEAFSKKSLVDLLKTKIK
jgi:hypothetical protein